MHVRSVEPHTARAIRRAGGEVAKLRRGGFSVVWPPGSQVTNHWVRWPRGRCKWVVFIVNDKSPEPPALDYGTCIRHVRNTQGDDA